MARAYTRVAGDGGRCNSGRATVGPWPGHGEFRIAASLPDAAVLMRELQDFRVRYSDAGNATFSAREGAHDDLVLAHALAVFGLSRHEVARDVPVVWAGR